MLGKLSNKDRSKNVKIIYHQFCRMIYYADTLDAETFCKKKQGRQLCEIA